LRLTTRPPKSQIYIDNVAVGQTTDNGQMLLEGIQSGNHHLRVSHDGFQDWLGDVVCDGKPQEVVAELRAGSIQDSRPAIPMPDTIVSNLGASTTPMGAMTGGGGPIDLDRTVQQNYQASGFDVAVGTMPPPKKSALSPILLGIGGLFALLLIGVIGVGAAYMLGLFGGPSSPPGGTNTTTPTPVQTPVQITADLAVIPGGTFKMGNNEGRENEKPENQVTVKPFRMDKTEVTNAEYYAFVSETGYRPVPAHWVNDAPVSGEEKMPVRFVNVDDANAFARWRSKRDGVTYRLPTEAEWEYATRNGSKNNKFPWGDSFQSKCAVTDKPNTEPDAVGTASCPNDWGVLDLIGNVYEWTGSKASLYPGSQGEIVPTRDPHNMIRGGAAFTKSDGEFAITSTFRQDVDASRRDKELGFRLVAEN
jgi:formylglycine-generating enzyme required for sulfatase activity